ncbi:MAG: PAS domain S-box protein [Desulfobulbaceae bacterium]|nr:PAS domain S-box protein [Desulfobulbaceae bacterium]
MKQQSLRGKITLVLAIVAIVSFSVSALYTGIGRYREITEEYATTMQARINVARSLLTASLLLHDEAIQSILQKSASLTPEQQLQAIKDSLHFDPPGDTYYILDSRNRVVLCEDHFSDYRGLDFSGIIPHGSNTDQKLVFHHQSLLNKLSVVSIVYPLKNNCKLVVERSLANIIPSMSHFEQGELYGEELFFVLATTGKTIYHPDRSLVKSRHNLYFDLKNMTTADETGLFSFQYHGKPFVAFRENFRNPLDWIIYYCIPRNLMIDKIKKTILGQLTFLFLLFCALFFILNYFLARFFSQPVSDFVATLKHSKDEDSLIFHPGISADIIEFEKIFEAITSRDEAVTQSTERLKTVLDSLDAMVYVADMDTFELLFVNRYGRDIWGDISGQKCYLSLQHNQNEPCPFCTNKLLLDKEGQPTGIHVWEFQNTVDGEWYECRDQAIPWIDGRIVRMEIATNISRRKQAEAGLLAEKERLSVTLRSIGDGVITTDTEGRIVLVNRVAESLIGRTQREAFGRPLQDVFHIINEKNGQTCPNPLDKIFESGEIVDLSSDTTLISRDGTRRTIADSGSPIRDQDSKIIGAVLVFRDVTDELKKEEELMKARKLESVGVLAGGIAHDFNNILVAILGNLSLAEQYISPDNADLCSLIQEAEKASLRAKNLTQQLLTFSKGGDPIKQTASLENLIKEPSDFVLSGSNVACNYVIPDTIRMVDVDPGQISQVIQNLIINAKQAMPGGGTIEITCSNISDEEKNFPHTLNKGKYVLINIKDTGTGIAASILDNIFDPYFTTKQDGSGLGLAVCHSIISKHGGLISVQSAEGQGTTFSIYLPASDAGKSGTAHKKENLTKGSGTVLLMDDEATIRTVAQRMLTHLGYDVVLASNGEEAIKLYKERLGSENAIDVSIMDLTIPGGMGGQDAVREILDVDPDAKVIVSSGYSNDPVMASFAEYGFKAAVAKPFNLTELGKTIKSVLSE